MNKHDLVELSPQNSLKPKQLFQTNRQLGGREGWSTVQVYCLFIRVTSVIRIRQPAGTRVCRPLEQFITTRKPAPQRLGSDGHRTADADCEIQRLQYPEHIKRYASANLTRSFNPWHKSTQKLLLDLYILECCC